MEAMLRSSAPRGLLPRGLGRSYGDAAQNAGGEVVDMTSLSGILDLDTHAGLVTVLGGTSLDTLTRALVPLGLFVPVTPGTRFVTVGGAIACDIHGKNHHRDGGFADHVVSFDLCTPERGRITVRPGQDGDVFHATAGGMGLTGIIVQATLRLLRISTSLMRVDTERASDLDDLMARMATRDDLYRYSVAWIDCLSGGQGFGRGILTRADHADADDLPARLSRDPLAYDPRIRLSARLLVPPFVLRRETASLFNGAWYRKSPRLVQGGLQPLASFFHPLDALAHWNRLYGPAGFLQYQFVVPFGAENTIRETLERLTKAGCPVYMGVLKRFGPGAGMLSFPRPGWTLALDVPAGAHGLGSLMDALDDGVATAGGRVYLAKDARLRPELLPIMYPELGKWRAVREALDPGHVMRSDMDRRLGLSGHPAPAPAAAPNGRAPKVGTTG